jgi:phosphoribosylformylglycinamidine cyclo-ligase
MAMRPQPSDDAYSAAGVSIAEGERAVDLMDTWVRKARRPEVVGGIGGFAGLFDASMLATMRRPLLATSADGVGTKVAIAQAMDKHDTVGLDLVGMLVDDLVVCGAEPLFLTDYIACGKVVPERIAEIVKGVAEGCLGAGCALIGGETAEHPGLLAEDEYDLAGSTTGVVEADSLLGAERVEPGDLLVAMGSSGLHSNGYSLIRRIFLDDAGWLLDRHVDDLGRTLGEELLEPTRIYAKPCLTLAGRDSTHALAHITGGGFRANLARVIPPGLVATIDRSTWRPAAIFQLAAEVGSLDRSDVESALNMGVGMAAVTTPDGATAAIADLQVAGIDAWVCGEVTRHPGQTGARIVGDYAR